MTITETECETTCIDVHSQLIYEVANAAEFQLQIAVRPLSQQSIESESVKIYHNDQQIDDSQWSEVAIPATENRCYRFRAEPGQWRIDYDAAVTKISQLQAGSHCLSPITSLPAEALPFLNPSRYCESDRFLQLAENQFGGLKRDDSLVEALENMVFNRTSYTMGSSNAQTTATDTYLSTEGVCRDFAHLLIVLCRALRIPARYTSGYLVELQPPDFHAAVEVFIGDHWQIYDATRLASLGGFVPIAIGLDAADVAFASFSGKVNMLNCTISAVARTSA
ncbi:transglutaminase-like domain-containing protein [Adhaeretor mobilis]|uniref:Transglutaminase-like superfamily protein n=1 Tax=Adhaeretor mobilis TaxID=1930276 RepID=A0A517MZF7_9BACT|nr:transglutaminase family protein [Adhaeretor mobilis]QDT00270.1 Transglutaminase-like superfamily protein [Adhaeretor mobilis]